MSENAANANKNKDSQEKEKKSQSSFANAFKQQVMKAWQPVPTINSTLVLFTILTIFFLVFGVILLAYSGEIEEFTLRYDLKCNIITPKNIKDRLTQDYAESDYCKLEFKIDGKLKAPVYVYYELDNFYQNHRRYVKSRVVDQLQGEDVNTKSDLSDCEPIVTNKEAGQKYSYTGVELDEDDVAIPCGLIAKSYFTDEFMLRKQDQPFGNKDISISPKGIAWPSDKKHKFKNSSNSKDKAWMDVENNERFIVWMRTAALPKFRKLWGKIDTDIEKGVYTLDVLNLYNVKDFDGKKTFIISTANAFGGKNIFLAVAYLVVGGICFFITIGFLIKKCITKKHKPQ